MKLEIWDFKQYFENIHIYFFLDQTGRELQAGRKLQIGKVRTKQRTIDRQAGNYRLRGSECFVGSDAPVIKQT